MNFIKNAEPLVQFVIVIADLTYRELVGRCLEEIELTPRLFATWQDAIATTTNRPALFVADLDDIGTDRTRTRR